jgi:hypothetical protein
MSEGGFCKLRIGLLYPRKGTEMKNRSEIWLSVLEDLGNTCSVSTREDAEYARLRVSAEGDSFFTVTLPQFAKDLERSLAVGELSTDMFVGFRRRTLGLPVLLSPGSADYNVKTKKMNWGVPLFLSGFTRRLFMEPDEWYRLLNNGVDVNAENPEIYGAPGVQNPNHVYPYILHQPPCVLSSPSSEEDADRMADAIFSVRQLCGLFSKEKAPAPAKAEKRAIDSYVEVDKELDRPL